MYILTFSHSLEDNRYHFIMIYSFISIHSIWINCYVDCSLEETRHISLERGWQLTDDKKTILPVRTKKSPGSALDNKNYMERLTQYISFLETGFWEAAFISVGWTISCFFSISFKFHQVFVAEDYAASLHHSRLPCFPLFLIFLWLFLSAAGLASELHNMNPHVVGLLLPVMCNMIYVMVVMGSVV